MVGLNNLQCYKKLDIKTNNGNTRVSNNLNLVNLNFKEKVTINEID